MAIKLEKVTEKFYQSLEEGKILGRKCPKCGAVEFPPVYACNTCGNYETEWYEISGNAKMHSIVMPAPLSSKPEYKALEEVYTSIDIRLDDFVRDYDASLEGLQIGKIEFLSETPNAGGLFHELLAWPGLTGLIDPTLLKYMELYSADISKGTGILEALKYMEIPVEASYAFGDGLNDLEMMDTVGTSLVMGNAGNELKAKADYVLPSVDEDGVADGIYRYILKTI